MVSQSDYNDAKVDAARSVMAEVFRALGEYREHIVLIGGFVPEMLIKDPDERHIGSLDVDIAVQRTADADEFYERIADILKSLEFSPDAKTPHRFVKKVPLGKDLIDVFVDLLAAEYGGRGRKHEHQHIQEIQARKARGSDLAFVEPVSQEIERTLPNGATAMVDVRIASIAAFLVMKAFALKNRRKDKDAYDIVYCLKNYSGGLDAIVMDFGKFGDHGLVREALTNLEKDFAAPEFVGPDSYANFLELAAGDDRELAVRDASERVLELVKRMKERKKL